MAFTAKTFGVLHQGDRARASEHAPADDDDADDDDDDAQLHDGDAVVRSGTGDKKTSNIRGTRDRGSGGGGRGSTAASKSKVAKTSP